MTNPLIQEFFELEKQAIKMQEAKKQFILDQYNTRNAFYKSLEIKHINSPHHPDFPKVYSFYTSFFTLPDETESFEGFEKTLALNNRFDLLKHYGSFEESWFYINNPTDNEIIAGINFSIYALNEKQQIDYNYAGTAHIIYVFVKPAYRGLGLAKLLLNKAAIYCQNFLKAQKPILYICEQNAPEKMTLTDYFSDNKNALIDQCDRLIWWDKIGYKRLDFNYIQPPLNPGQEACTQLTLNAQVNNLKSLPSFLIEFHLERFFKLAVFKGIDALIDDTYRTQMLWFKQHKTINLNGNKTYYENLKKKFYVGNI